MIQYLGGSSVDKEYACNAGDVGSIPGLGRSSGEGNGNPLQYSRLENPMNGGAWKQHSKKSDTTKRHFHFHTVAKLLSWDLSWCPVIAEPMLSHPRWSRK